MIDSVRVPGRSVAGTTISRPPRLIRARISLSSGERQPVAAIRAFDHLTNLIEVGKAMFHDKIRDEIRRYAGKEDLPTTWTEDCFHRRILPPASLATIRDVMRAVPTIVNANKQREDADPWIVAYALELQRLG